MRLVLTLVAVGSLTACTLQVHVHEAAPAIPEVPPASAPEVSGTWTVRGHDSVPWTAELVLDASSHEGHFDWHGPDGLSGHELVVWQFDPHTGLIALKGTEMQQPHGPVGVGTYVAHVTPDRQRIVNGTWGPPARLGTWEATR